MSLPDTNVDPSSSDPTLGPDSLGPSKQPAGGGIIDMQPSQISKVSQLLSQFVIGAGVIQSPFASHPQSQLLHGSAQPQSNKFLVAPRSAHSSIHVAVVLSQVSHLAQSSSSQHSCMHLQPQHPSSSKPASSSHCGGGQLQGSGHSQKT